MCNDPLFSLQDIFLPEKMTSKLVIFFLLLFDMGNTNELFHKLDLFGPTVVFTDFCKQKKMCWGLYEQSNLNKLTVKL